MLDSFDFRQLVILYLSLGPQKQRELALFAGVAPEVVERWGMGTERPVRHTENHLLHYLRSKLSDFRQLRKDKEAQEADFARAYKKLEAVATQWDNHIASREDLTEEETADLLQRKEAALETIRQRLKLPKPQRAS